MKKNLIILSVALLFFYSCREPAQKPFIIIGKHKWVGYDSYQFIDKNGIKSEWFEDEINKYNIGDTLK